jgi:hypothetical protein
MFCKTVDVVELRTSNHLSESIIVHTGNINILDDVVRFLGKY